MFILENKKVAFIALASAVFAMTGCSTKTNKSQVAVSPLGLYGSAGGIGGNGAGYDGGPLVNNSAGVTGQAGGLQNTVYFAYDSSSLDSKSTGVLDQHGSLMGDNEGSRVLIVGHTDPRGSREYNMALGERRAQSVGSYLVSKGVDIGNIEATSRGEEDLAAPGGTGESAYAQDRRAVLSY